MVLTSGTHLLPHDLLGSLPQQQCVCQEAEASFEPPWLRGWSANNTTLSGPIAVPLLLLVGQEGVQFWAKAHGQHQESVS